jgi:dTDP-3-amino-3,4,6-trideoxy-alpha-D-glucose transaminase
VPAEVIDPVRSNDFKRLWADVGPEVLAAVETVGKTGWYVLGPSVTRFEQALARLFGLGFSVGCASGLDAIEISLRALCLPHGAPVLTTPLSAFATTLAILRAGGTPVFADVDHRGHLDLHHCEQILKDRPDIRHLVPVHLYGNAMNLSDLRELKQRFELRVVEDCAQSIGAHFDGRAAGTIGDLAAVSFYPTKNLGALGDGGAIVTGDDHLRDRCAVLRNYGQSSQYVHDELGLNSRLDEVHADILDSVFLPRLAAWTSRRRELASRYLNGIAHPRLRPLEAARESLPVWHLFPVFVPAAGRESFQRHLRDAGIESAVHYPRLIPDQAALRAVKVEVVGPLTRAGELAASEVSLPIHPYLTDPEQDRVIGAINSWRAP